MKMGARLRVLARDLAERFREDFHFAIIIAFGALAILTISGFAVYRFATGYWVGGVMNTTIVLSVALVLAYVCRMGNTERAGMFFAVVTVAACIVSSAVFGRTGILWGFVVLWVNFLLTQRRLALVLNLLLITMLTLENQLFQSAVEVTTYIITAGLVTVFAFIFAERLSSQQRQLEDLASCDHLTGAGNRRSMKLDLDAAVEEFQDTGQPFALMLLDLDHFKALNDDYGHEAGDRALKSLARTIWRRIREEDGFYRFGGEEFVVLFPDTGGRAAQRLARDLHAGISGEVAGPGGPIHFSAGVAVLEPGEDWERWLARADRALYRAKQAGRNRLEFSRSAGPETAPLRTGESPA